MGRFIQHTDPYTVTDNNVNWYGDSGCHAYFNLDETPIVNGNRDKNSIANFAPFNIHAHGNTRLTHFTTAAAANITAADITAAHIATAANTNRSITDESHSNTSGTRAEINIGV
jgi:hypothetical protein